MINVIKKRKYSRNFIEYRLQLIYFDINATIPVISITSIATYNSHRANPGNRTKMINKIMARPTSDPPFACCVSTIFFTSLATSDFTLNIYCIN